MRKRAEEREGKRCPSCGGALPSGGRSDMKFCCDACRARWHYATAGRAQGLRRKTIASLDRNHAILENLLGRGVVRISVPDLAQMGYNFNCITSYHKVGSRNEYRCFDIKYYMSASGVFRIERCGDP